MPDVKKVQFEEDDLAPAPDVIPLDDPAFDQTIDGIVNEPFPTPAPTATEAAQAGLPDVIGDDTPVQAGVMPDVIGDEPAQSPAGSPGAPGTSGIGPLADGETYARMKTGADIVRAQSPQTAPGPLSDPAKAEAAAYLPRPVVTGFDSRGFPMVGPARPFTDEELARDNVLTSVGTAFTEGAMLNSGDEGLAAAVAAKTGRPYAEVLGEINREKDLAEYSHPWLYKGFEAAGTVANVALLRKIPGIGPLLSSTSLAGRIKAATLLGGAYGAMSSPESVAKNPVDVATRAGIGSVTAPIFQESLIGTGRAIGWTMRKASPAARKMLRAFFGPQEDTLEKYGRGVASEYEKFIKTGEQGEIPGEIAAKDIPPKAEEIRDGILDVFANVTKDVERGKADLQAEINVMNSLIDTAEKAANNFDDTVGKMAPPDALAGRVMTAMDKLKMAADQKTREADAALDVASIGIPARVVNSALTDAIKALEGRKNYLLPHEAKAAAELNQWRDTIFPVIKPKTGPLLDASGNPMVTPGGRARVTDNTTVPAYEVREIMKSMGIVGKAGYVKTAGGYRAEDAGKQEFLNLVADSRSRLRTALEKAAKDGGADEYLTKIKESADLRQLRDRVRKLFPRPEKELRGESMVADRLVQLSKKIHDGDQEIINDLSRVTGIDIAGEFRVFQAAKEVAQNPLSRDDWAEALVKGAHATDKIKMAAMAAPGPFKERLQTMANLMEQENLVQQMADNMESIVTQYKDVLDPVVASVRKQVGKFSLTAGASPKWNDVQITNAVNRAIKPYRRGILNRQAEKDAVVFSALEAYDKTGQLQDLTGRLNDLALSHEFYRTAPNGSRRVNAFALMASGMARVTGVHKEFLQAAAAPMALAFDYYGGGAARVMYRWYVRKQTDLAAARMKTALPLAISGSGSATDFIIQPGTPHYAEVVRQVVQDPNLSATKKAEILSGIKEGIFADFSPIKLLEDAKEEGPTVRGLDGLRSAWGDPVK